MELGYDYGTDGRRGVRCAAALAELREARGIVLAESAGTQGYEIHAGAGCMAASRAAATQGPEGDGGLCARQVAGSVSR